MTFPELFTQLYLLGILTKGEYRAVMEHYTQPEGYNHAKTGIYGHIAKEG